MKIKLNDLFRIGLILLFVISLFNCKKEMGSKTGPLVIKDTSIVNRFIYTGLQTYYLWEDSIPNLKATKYNNADTLNAYLNSYKDPQKFFTSLLYQYSTVDKWSFLVNDSTTISNWIQGISKTMGYDFWYAPLGTSTSVVIIVKYVYKGSPAEKAGLKRGDLFLKVGGTQLTTTNWEQLLLTNPTTYTLAMASISGNTVSLNNL